MRVSALVQFGLRSCCLAWAMIAARLDTVQGQATNPTPAYDQNGTIIDVGTLINLQRDVKHGSWVLKGPLLYSHATGLSILQLPVVAPHEYVLDIDVMRTSGTQYFGVALVIGDHQCYVDFDGPTSGIGLLDGKSAKVNSTMVPNFHFPIRQFTTLRIIVLKDGVTTANVSPTARQTIAHWQGDLKRLKLPPNWAGPDKDKLYLKADGGYAVGGIRLMPVKSK
jgi:hypothetical protein